MNLDRVKDGLRAFVEAQFPQIDFHAEYGGRVVAQNGSNSFDFQPDNTRLPSMKGLPLCLPFPGWAVTVDPTQNPRARVGWRDGDPSKPEVRLWEANGLTAAVLTASQKASLVAPAVNLGADPGSDALVKGTTFISAMATFLAGLASAATVANVAAAASAMQATLGGPSLSSSLSGISKTS